MTQRVLILCTGNSARSQMAEGLLRSLAAGRIEVFSAGTAPSSVNPLAIQVMRERDIDISHQRSKHLREFQSQPFDVVITVCDQAAEQCPIFSGRAERIHWSFPDPAAVHGPEEERLVAFRAVREALEERLRAWLLTEPFTEGASA
ncbi:MAG: arsenate reductase ArsC [Chloroflexota bacterium]|nr:arsenate reductase ArsC [Chloroflexota bacterium]